MEAISITDLLVHASAPDASLRTPAEQGLLKLEAEKFPVYVTSLCTELRDPQKPPVSRHLAGILLKNSLVAKDDARQAILHQRWNGLQHEVRVAIKHAVLATLASPLREARSTAAMVIAKIAAIELPQGLWPDLIELLLHNISAAPSPDLKQSTFETLGYVCEECPDQLQGSSGAILNAISQGMMDAETNQNVKLAATSALANSLEFAKNNMLVDRERDLIMSMIMSAAASPEMKVRVAAFLCLVKVASLYYDQIDPYMNSIFLLTRNAITNDAEEVALQAFEFWSSICDEEILIGEIVEECLEKNKAPYRVCRHFAKVVLAPLVPLIVECLMKQAEDADEFSDDTWNVATAAGLCLSLLAQAVRDDIVPHILPFIEQNIRSENWHAREAATLAFGSILDGPSKQHLGHLVSVAFDVILGHMTDPSVHVRDTAAWTVGRICDVLPEIIDQAMLNKLMNAFVVGLRDHPPIAGHICWAIHCLAEAIESKEQPTSELSKYFEGLVSALLEASDRPDLLDSRLLCSAYEAISVLISTAAKDCLRIIEQLLLTLMNRLQLVLAGPVGDDRGREVQGLLCGALQVIIVRLTPDTVVHHADSLMMMFLRVLQSKSATLSEEAFMAIGAIASCVKGGFIKYMDTLKPFLIDGLKNTFEPQVCQVSVGVLGDICRALGSNVAPYCDEFVNILLIDLSNPNLDRSVNPHIIACFGDIALALKGGFDRYVAFVMRMLVDASQAKFEQVDFGSIDYLNALRLSILDTYTGIIAGLADDNKAAEFQPFIPPIINLLTLIANDPDRETGVLSSSIGLIGDLIQNLGEAMRPFLEAPCVHSLLQQGLGVNDKSVVDSARWASGLLQQLRGR
uniref:Importin N-terminal domain-containing protein n=1 Tax=Spongospora subterranea TaxID=70186 RepID=A0A0H5R571_9EUKA|eukprot:CRZ09310.1 hypothetical protein [Spongospora subterranea]